MSDSYGKDSPFRAIKSAWMTKIRTAIDAKKDFQADADEGMRFYTGPYDFLYGAKEGVPGRGDFIWSGDEGMPKPSMCITYNKVAEAVQLFGPALYHTNPVRNVNPREFPLIPIEAMGSPQDPNIQAQFVAMQQSVQMGRAQDEARAVLFRSLLNYTPAALDLKSHARQAIDETLIKGMGVMWTEVFQPAGSQTKMIGSFYESVDTLLLDCDMEAMEDAKWCSRRFCRPVWQVEQEFGYPPGTLKGNTESLTRQAEVGSAGGEGEIQRRKGYTNDLLVYYKVYSKMGIGSLLEGAEKDSTEWDRFGQYVMLVISDACEHPLNLPPGIEQDDQAIMKALQWETPYWADDSWPFTPFIFHRVPRQVWPMSHFKPALGELKFLNWAYSFIASKIRKACKDIIVCKKALGEEMKRVIVSGADYELAELEEAHGSVSDIVAFLQHPAFQGDIWKVIEAIERNFEKRVGLTELMYGETANQLRSATETQVKSDQLKIRPDDMANKIEEAMSEVAKKEAFAAKWHLEPQDVAPILGPLGAQWWQQFVLSAPPTDIVHGLQFRIEAGSARKPNKDRDIANANQAMQNMFQPLLSVASTGQVQPINAVMTMWCKANDIDPSGFMIQPPPPPPENTGPTEGDLRAQSMQQDEQSFQMKMRHDSEKHNLDLKHQQEKLAAQKKIDAEKVKAAKAKSATNGSAA